MVHAPLDVASSSVARRLLPRTAFTCHERFEHMNKRRTLQRAASIGALAVAAGTGIATAQPAPDYAGFERGVYLPYLNAARGLQGRSPSLGLSFGRGVVRATMDTGSTGVVVAASTIPDFQSLPSLGEGKLTYTSSGRVMIGRWVRTPMTIHGADGTVARIDSIPVLGVTRVECLEKARNCTPSAAPRGIAMIGIGFAREADQQSQSTPDKNPFLHLATEGVAYRPGYVVTRFGVHVGLTRANTQGPFNFFKLAQDPGHGDWASIPACITIAGRQPPACGSMLMDTGVTTMYMTVPTTQAPSGATTLLPNREVAIALGNAQSSVPIYTFRTDDPESTMAPKGVVLRVSGAAAPFVNTTVNFLNGYDYLYDAAEGYIGLRARP
jgi:hypothetical protein